MLADGSSDEEIHECTDESVCVHVGSDIATNMKEIRNTYVYKWIKDKDVLSLMFSKEMFSADCHTKPNNLRAIDLRMTRKGTAPIFFLRCYFYLPATTLAPSHCLKTEKNLNKQTQKHKEEIVFCWIGENENGLRFGIRPRRCVNKAWPWEEM